MSRHGIYNTFQSGPSGSFQTSVQPFEPDSFRGNVGKPSGKVSGYMMWLNAEGRQQFFNKYGYVYHQSPSDRDKIDEIYQTVPQERRDMYKERERVANSKKEEVAQRRHAKSSANRDCAHRDPYRHEQARIQHERQLELVQQEERERRGPIQMPLAENDYQPNVARHQDVFYMRQKNRAEMQRIFGVSLQSFGTSSILDRQFQFLGALSYCNMLLGNHNYAYPAELAVVSFTLRGGVTQWETCPVAFDPECFYTEREAQANPAVFRLRETIIKDAEEAKRKYALPGGGLSLSEAREWFQSRRNVRALMVCDGNNWGEVASAMLTVAISQTHVVANADHSAIISTVAIQDVADAIAKATKSSASHQFIEDHFTSDRRAREHFCEVHGGLRLNDTRRYSCQLARAAVHLQLFFEFLRDYRLVDFARYYTNGIHNFCSETAGRSLPLYDVPPLSHLNINDAIQDHPSDSRPNPQSNFTDENNRRSDSSQASRFSAPGRVQGDGQMPSNSRLNEHNGQRVADNPPIARLGSSVVNKSCSDNNVPSNNMIRRSSLQNSSGSSTFKFNWTVCSDNEIAELRASIRPQPAYKGRFLKYEFNPAENKNSCR